MNSWKEFIEVESKKDYYIKLSSLVQEDSKNHTIFPSHENVFNAFKYCPLDKVKVLILGQDPYHGPGQAHGLSFSVPEGQDIPPSLKNIFSEINSDLGTNHSFKSGCLLDWAKQGVLLLNSILTVRKNEPASHKNYGWEIFTDNTLSLINNLDRPIVCMLWGNFARSKKLLLNNSKHLILESGHPSPFSYKLFKGNKHFSAANKFLENNSITPINWII